MKEKDLSELIERYLDGELHGIELEQFNSKLLSDPEFAKEVELQDEVNKAIIENRIQEFKNNIDEHQIENGPGLKLARIVGSLVILALLVIFYISLNESSKVRTGEKDPDQKTKPFKTAGAELKKENQEHHIE